MENATMNKEPVTGDMLIANIIKKYPDATFLLMNCGMGCVSCPASQMESLTEACAVHGLDAEEVARYLNVELGLIEMLPRFLFSAFFQSPGGNSIVFMAFIAASFRQGEEMASHHLE